MAKTAVTLIVALVTGLVVAPLPARAEVAQDYGGYGPPIAIAFVITNGPLVSCYDMRAHVGSAGVKLDGNGYQVNNVVLVQGQAVLGYALIHGDEVVWGFEAFPTPAAQVAAKIGGSFLISTLLGTGFGYHLLGSQIFPFSFALRLAFLSCQQALA